MNKIFLNQKKINILTLTYWLAAIGLLITSCGLLIAQVVKGLGFAMFIISMMMIISPLGIILTKALRKIM